MTFRFEDVPVWRTDAWQNRETKKITYDKRTPHEPSRYHEALFRRVTDALSRGAMVVYEEYLSSDGVQLARGYVND